jgi:hypothetical protein
MYQWYVGLCNHQSGYLKSVKSYKRAAHEGKQYNTGHIME